MLIQTHTALANPCLSQNLRRLNLHLPTVTARVNTRGRALVAAMAGKLQGKTVLVTGEDYKVPAAYRTFELNNMVTSYNKVVLVTGSTDGIGKHTAERLAKDGATVLVHGRSAEKAKAAANSISKASGNQNIEPFAADLSSMSQVRNLADDVKAAHPDGIDMLANNAGIFPDHLKRSIILQKTDDGYESTWAVNVMAPFLLTSLLLDHIKDSIVNVSSISAGSSMDFNNLQQEQGFSGHDAYALSKLAMQMFTKDLAEIAKPRGITVNCLDPGTVNSKLLDAGWGMCGIDIKDANDEYKMLTDPAMDNVTGQYRVSHRPRSMARAVEDKAARDRLWKTLEEQTGAQWPQRH